MRTHARKKKTTTKDAPGGHVAQFLFQRNTSLTAAYRSPLRTPSCIASAMHELVIAHTTDQADTGTVTVTVAARVAATHGW